MLGAIIGDITGSCYERRNVYKRSSVKVLEDSAFRKACFTDDTVLTIAVARALTENITEIDEDELKKKVAKNLKDYYKKYPKAGCKITNPYGNGFGKWAKQEGVEDRTNAPNTNGAAMRAAAIGWLYDGVEDIKRIARITAEPTHNTAEAIKATQAAACAVYWTRTTKDKNKVKTLLEAEFGYQFADKNGEEIARQVSAMRKDSKKYRWNPFKPWINCDAETTIHHAIYAFLISKDFEDCIKTAISFGGDSDTIACIAGAIAEAYYGISEDLRDLTIKILKETGCKPDDLKFISEFAEAYGEK